MAQSPSTAVAASRPWGPWFFTGIWVVFWCLLALSGLDVFKDLEEAELRYAVPAVHLEGVTQLRIERDPGGTHYVPRTRVVLGGAGEVALTLQNLQYGRRGGSRKPEQVSLEARPKPPIMAFREADVLILRWPRPERKQGAEPVEDDGLWISEITLPVQFQNLALSHAMVEAMEPVGRLKVSGRSVEVRGRVAHLDLQSTQCGRCALALGAQGTGDCEARSQHGGDPSLEVAAGGMQSVRIAAEVGQVVLKSAQGLQKLDLRLGDNVALSVDRVGVLRLAHTSLEDANGGGCAVISEPRPAHVPSSPLELVRIGARPAQAQ
jgi:hypothetical protein